MGRKVIKKVVEVEREVYYCDASGEEIQEGEEVSITIGDKQFYVTQEQASIFLEYLGDGEDRDVVHENSDPNVEVPVQENVVSNDEPEETIDHSKMNAKKIRELARREAPKDWTPPPESAHEAEEEGFDPFLRAQRQRTDINSKEIRNKMRKRVAEDEKDKDLGDSDNRKSVRYKNW